MEVVNDLERKDIHILTDATFKSNLEDFEGVDNLKIEEPKEKEETKIKVINITKKKGLFKNL